MSKPRLTAIPRYIYMHMAGSYWQVLLAGLVAIKACVLLLCSVAQWVRVVIRRPWVQSSAGFCFVSEFIYSLNVSSFIIDDLHICMKDQPFSYLQWNPLLKDSPNK